MLELVSAKGEAYPGVEPVLKRPQGPLTEHFRPQKLVSDGAGVLHVPLLEAGKHRIRFLGIEREFTVPAISGSMVEATRVRIVADS